MDYRRNEDKWRIPDKPLYNRVIDYTFETEGPENIELSELKEHLNIAPGITDFDNRLTSLLKQCRAAVETFTGLSLIPKTVKAYLNNSLGNIELPYGPVRTSLVSPTGIVSMENYIAEPVLADSYRINGLGFKRLQYPTYDEVTVTYFAGYESANLPPALRLAIIKEVVFQFEHRGEEAVTNINSLCPEAEALAIPFKRITWLA
jgi:uncharacterized phiE125 gp8 family phage protein